MDQATLPDITTAPAEPTQQPQQIQPIKTVETFWERLDEVLQLVKQGSLSSNGLEEIIENFAETEQIKQGFRSFLFQPERISVSSNNDVVPSNSTTAPAKSDIGHLQAETFSSFRVRLNKALVGVKSIQLLSAVIPNAVQNIPDNQIIFFYYRIRNVADSIKGTWDSATTYLPGDIVSFLGNNYVALLPSLNQQPVGVQLDYWWKGPINLPSNTIRPNYYDLNPYRIQAVYLLPSFGFSPEYAGPPYTIYNRTFQSYDELAASLNVCANDVLSASTTGDIEFTYNAILNKFTVQGTQFGVYYLPCGYEDTNIPLAMGLITTDPTNSPLVDLSTYKLSDIYSPGYSLNLRLGFTWNGLFESPLAENPFFVQPYVAPVVGPPPVPAIPYSISTLPLEVWTYMRPADPAVRLFTANGPGVPGDYTEQILTANSYGDLVNTSCVRVYCDITFGSTQDSDGNGGLLTTIPVNTTNLGVTFYQNNFNNPLTKIPKTITEIGIRMLTDQGRPYNLPNSATVLLELGVEYY